MKTKLLLQQALKDQYANGLTDYTMPPLVHTEGDIPIGRIKDGDTVFYCCRRGDRERQLLEALVEPGFDKFPIDRRPEVAVVPLVQFHEKFADLPTVFPVIRPDGTLGEALSRAGVVQTRIAESEKSAHVTFFFNGRRVDPYPGERWLTVPSPHSSEFLAKPATSTMEVALEVESAMAMTGAASHFIVVNLAAGDIIGHLDDWNANVLCAASVDRALGVIATAAAVYGYTVVVTADHGLLESFTNDDGSRNLAHTSARVPFVVVPPPGGPDVQMKPADDATLADVAPTLLTLMGLPVPEEMTGIPRATSEGAHPRVVLVVMDGWGVGKDDPASNPIAAADTPFMDRILKRYPHMTLAAAGLAVGLPEGRSGNSETGHLTIGTGRVIPQDELRIAQALQAGELADNPAVKHGFDFAGARGGEIHVLTLLSLKSSHGNMEEGLAVLRAAQARGIRRAWIHLILDGRSSPPQGGPDLLDVLESRLPAGIDAEAVTAMGRGIALDRSGSYSEKTQAAYRALVMGEGIRY